MSVKIRLTIKGKRHQRTYRVVAQDAKAKRDGKFIEILGYWDPNKKAADQLKLDKDKIKSWQEKGAQISQAVNKLMQ